MQAQVDDSEPMAHSENQIYRSLKVYVAELGGFDPQSIFASDGFCQSEDSSVYWVTIPESVGTQEVFLSFFRNNMFQLSGISGKN